MLARYLVPVAWCLFGGYWLLLVVSTHLPPEAATTAESFNDKLLHFTAYAVLAFLAAAVWRVTRRRYGPVAAMVLLPCLLVVAALDEATQPYFDRSCDLHDWCSDAVGAIAGLLFFGLVNRWTPSLRGGVEAGGSEPDP